MAEHRSDEWSGNEFLTAGAAAALAGSDFESSPDSVPVDAKSEARKIAFDKIGNGDKILLISGFPQTRRS
jgi:hypothetical protein